MRRVDSGLDKMPKCGDRVMNIWNDSLYNVLLAARQRLIDFLKTPILNENFQQSPFSPLSCMPTMRFVSDPFILCFSGCDVLYESVQAGSIAEFLASGSNRRVLGSLFSTHF